MHNYNALTRCKIINFNKSVANDNLPLNRRYVLKIICFVYLLLNRLVNKTLKYICSVKNVIKL